MPNTYRLTVTLPVDLVERFRAACYEDGRTLQGCARVLIEKYLADRETVELVVSKLTHVEKKR